MNLLCRSLFEVHYKTAREICRQAEEYDSTSSANCWHSNTSGLRARMYIYTRRHLLVDQIYLMALIHYLDAQTELSSAFVSSVAGNAYFVTFVLVKTAWSLNELLLGVWDVTRCMFDTHDKWRHTHTYTHIWYWVRKWIGAVNVSDLLPSAHGRSLTS